MTSSSNDPIDLATPENSPGLTPLHKQVEEIYKRSKPKKPQPNGIMASQPNKPQKTPMTSQQKQATSQKPQMTSHRTQQQQDKPDIFVYRQPNLPDLSSEQINNFSRQNSEISRQNSVRTPSLDHHRALLQNSVRTPSLDHHG